MDLKDILVCLDPTEAGERRLRLAARSRANTGQIFLQHTFYRRRCPACRPLKGWDPGSRRRDRDRARNRGRRSAAPGRATESLRSLSPGAELADIVKQRFPAEVQPHRVDGDWHLFGSGDSEELIALSRTMDLVVFGQAASDYRLPTGFSPDDVVMATGRPMLLVPFAGELGLVGRRVLIAWDGTREASRALHDALPLIARAEAVCVMMVRARDANSDDLGLLLDRVVRHLQRHSITATMDESMAGKCRRPTCCCHAPWISGPTSSSRVPIITRSCARLSLAGSAANSWTT